MFECYLLFLKTDGEYLMVLWWDNHSGSAKPFSRRSHCPSSTNTDNMERVGTNIAQNTELDQENDEDLDEGSVVSSIVDR